jgi:hypothetical protein
VEASGKCDGLQLGLARVRQLIAIEIGKDTPSTMPIGGGGQCNGARGLAPDHHVLAQANGVQSGKLDRRHELLCRRVHAVLARDACKRGDGDGGEDRQHGDHHQQFDQRDAQDPIRTRDEESPRFLHGGTLSAKIKTKA